jgi:diguanylate cyclase (GGDEF)-like protein
VIYVVGTAFVVVVMTKERVALVHKTAAMTDLLTGLFNRRAFLEASRAMIEKRARKSQAVSLLMFDLDKFKSINDRFGHAIGDRVLQIFAEVANAVMRRSDIVGRLGGEEFAAMLVDTTHDRAMSVAEQIRADFAEATQEVDGRPVVATVSIGVVISQDSVCDMSTLLAQADHALYSAKEKGRNRVELASLELILDRADRSAAQLIAAVGAKSVARSAAKSAA